MYKWWSVVALAVLLISCGQKEPGENDASCQDKMSEEELASIRADSAANTNGPTQAGMQPPSGEITVTVFENPAGEGVGGFGYDLLDGGKQTIHQPHIPAISGLKGFASKADAEKAGRLMKYKMENGIMPPTISVEELDSMKIVH